MTTISPPRPSPFLTIWGEPRATFRRIVEIDPGYLVLPLAAASGIAPMLGYVPIAIRAAPAYSIYAAGVAVLLVCGLFSVARLYVESWLLVASGEWLGGTADRTEIRTVLAWSSVPSVAAQCLLGVPLLLLPRLDPVSFEDPGFWMMVLGVLLAQNFVVGAVLHVWSLVILCKGLGEMQGFSAWKGLLNLVLSRLLGVLFLLLLAGVAIAVAAPIFSR
jgi:hypothetical protein